MKTQCPPNRDRRDEPGDQSVSTAIYAALSMATSRLRLELQIA